MLGAGRTCLAAGGWASLAPRAAPSLVPSPATAHAAPQGKYQHGRKNGHGVYHFTNGDVYLGEFSNDRMEGAGVYAFGPEGLYEGG